VTWSLNSQNIHPGADVFEDRKLDISSQINISVEDTLRRIEQEINAKQT
jgi:hypothetical protein